MGNGYSEIIPDISDFSNPEKAFRQSIGRDRKIRLLKVQVRVCQTPKSQQRAWNYIGLTTLHQTNKPHNR